MSNDTTTRTPEFFEQQSKQRMAAHEAGHVAVALACGATQVNAYIEQEDPAEYPPIGRQWDGWAEYCPLALEIHPTADGQRVPSVSYWDKPLSVSIAGAVAQFRYEHPGCSFADFELILLQGEEDHWMSETDLTPFESMTVDAVVDAKIEAAREAWNLLDANREFFEWARAELLENECLIDFIALGKFKQLQAAA